MPTLVPVDYDPFASAQPQQSAPPAGHSLVPVDYDPFAAAPDAQPRSPSMAQDVVQGVGRGAIEAAGYVLGMPADVWHMLDTGAQYALTKGAEKVGLLTPEQGAGLRAPLPGEASSVSSEAINRHLLNLSQSMGADTSAPTTLPGKYAETMTSFAGSAGPLAAEGVAQLPTAAAKYGLLPGAVSETAGEATKGTAAEPYARAIGAVAPQAIGAGLSAAARRVYPNPIDETAAGLTPQQAQDAQGILDRSRRAGAPLTVPEAVQAATGAGTRLGDVQRVVEQSPRGAAITRPFFAQRPAQTDTLGRSAADAVAFPSVEPTEVAPRVQAAAAEAVSQADKARTAAVDPLYKAAAPNTVPAVDMEQFLSKIDGLIANDRTGLLSNQLLKFRDALTESPGNPVTGQPRMPLTDIESLDTARKFFRDQIDQPAVAQDAIPKQVGAKMGSLLNELRQLMVDNSPDFAAGKKLYQSITENTVNPLLRSPTGQLAEAEKFPQQAEILFAPNPLPNSEGAVAKAVKDVGATDPEAAEQMVRMHVEQAFNRATKDNISGSNQWGAPKFVAMVMGEPQQAKNLEAAIRALPYGDTRWDAFKNSMEIMKAMGQRQPVGSQTAFNQQLQQYMKAGHPAAEFLADAASPARWTTKVHDMYQHFAYGQNTETLARIFTEGNVQDLQELARAPARTLRGQAALVGALARIGASSGHGATAP